MTHKAIGFDDVNVDDIVYLPGRKEKARIQSVVGTSNRRTRVLVVTESGHALTILRNSWAAWEVDEKDQGMQPEDFPFVAPPVVTETPGHKLPKLARPNVRRQPVDLVKYRQAKRAHLQANVAPTPAAIAQQPDSAMPGPPVPMPTFPERERPTDGLWNGK